MAEIQRVSMPGRLVGVGAAAPATTSAAPCPSLFILSSLPSADPAGLGRDNTPYSQRTPFRLGWGRSSTTSFVAFGIDTHGKPVEKRPRPRRKSHPHDVGASLRDGVHEPTTSGAVTVA